MKTMKNLALMGAIALTGAVGFTACSSSDDVTVNNPDFNPETNSVKTEFTISLPNYVGSITRQTAAVAQAQATPTFRGMQNIKLIPYGATVGTTSTPLNSKVFELPNFGNSTDPGWDLATQQAKVYRNLDVPIGTKVFMFYSQAKVDGTPFNNGKLNAPESFAGAASTYNFSLQPIQTSYTYSATGDPKGYAICQYLKGIRETSGITSTALQSLLTNFKPTAASSASVQFAVQALWDQVTTYTTTDGKDLVKASIEGTSNAFATISAGDVVTFTANTDLTGYPANLNLPDGAVAIDWSTPETPVINGPSGGLSVTDLTKYVYPAALYYRANSLIGVSSNAKVSESYGTDNWATIAASDKYTWTDAVVDANTRSIALQDQIQYAVGRFDLTIKAADATLNDNYGNPVPVNTDGFPVSAVIIGGQKNVQYDFTPASGSATYTIYDKEMNGPVAAKNGTAVGTNHTLVLETAESATEVNVAVELTNNTGIPFKGRDGTVPAGGKFYLVGTLDLSNATQPAADNRTKIFEQDYTTSANFTINVGTSAGTNTPAKDTNTTGLGAAYNVIPDLTVSQLEVAFSVDLEWKSGLTFNIGF